MKTYKEITIEILKANREDVISTIKWENENADVVKVMKQLVFKLGCDESKNTTINAFISDTMEYMVFNAPATTCNPNELGEINKARAFAQWNR